jgi:hypothetical protein
MDDGKRTPFVPFTFRADLVEKMHTTHGHLGLSGLYQIMSERYWWPQMKGDIRKWLKYCPKCQLCSSSDYTVKEPLHPMPVRYIEPFSRWGIDFIGPLPKGPHGNKYLLTAIDYCTKWPLAKAVECCSAEVAAKFIEQEIVSTYGIPEEIVSDRGAAFNSAILEALLARFKIKHLMTSAYHPRTNGAVERFNGEIGKILKKYCTEDKHKWELYVPQAMLAIRIRLHNSTGYSPFYLVYGRQARIPGDLVLPNIDNEQLDNVGNRLNELQAIPEATKRAKLALERSREKMKRQFDKKVVSTNFKQGDSVLLRNEAAKKFETTWFGPYTITHLYQNGVVRLTDPKGNELDGRVHKDRLKIAITSDNEKTSYQDLKNRGWKWQKKHKVSTRPPEKTTAILNRGECRNHDLY